MTVADVTGTGVRKINIDVGASSADVDNVAVHGRSVADNLNISAFTDPVDSMALIRVIGLDYDVFIGGTEVLNPHERRCAARFWQ